MNIRLSILIPHIPKYDRYYAELRDVLDPQLDEGVEVVVWTDMGQTTVGEKRNWLLNKARGRYVCFVDSDDLVASNYVELLSEGIEKNVDCCSLTGEITFDGKNPRPFIHSVKYDKWFEKDGVYYRPPNHLNCIKADIAKRFRFPMTNTGEDHRWSMLLQKAGVLKVEHWIEQTIYHYRFRNK